MSKSLRDIMETERSQTKQSTKTGAAFQLLSGDEGTVRCTVRMSRATHAQVERLAKIYHSSVNSVVNAALLAYLDANKDLLN